VEAARPLFAEGMRRLDILEKFQESRHVNCTRNHIFKGFIAVLSDTRNFTEMESSYTDFIGRGNLQDSSHFCKCVPDIYKILLRMAFKQENTSLALEYWQKMDQMNLNPTRQQYQMMCKFLARHQDREKMLEWITLEGKKYR
jgi:pentatricopeptide repeat protein